MSKRVTQSYVPEFRADAVRLVLEQGLTAAEEQPG
jgi:transposase-like protein